MLHPHPFPHAVSAQHFWQNLLSFQSIRLSKDIPYSQDIQHMQQACAWAQTPHISYPNPHVGCLVAQDGNVLAYGKTAIKGGPHAEVVALNTLCGQNIEQATLYVALEPCAHHGDTPPCVDKIIASGIQRVVILLPDPNPLVNGKGAAILRSHGITVEYLHHAPLQALAAYNMRGFLYYQLTKKPWVRLKLAKSLDAYMALKNGQSQWLTGEEARLHNQYQRARAGLIITGIGTVLADQPRMDVRIDTPRMPDVWILDRQARFYRDADVQTPLHRTGVSCVHQCMYIDVQRADSRIDIPDVYIPTSNTHTFLEDVLQKAADSCVQEIHIEAGPTLTQAFLAENLCHELLLYTAPVLLGSGMPIYDLPGLMHVGDAQRWHLCDITALGDDVMSVYVRPHIMD